MIKTPFVPPELPPEITLEEEDMKRKKVSKKSRLHYGDVIYVDTHEKPNWVADNWYRIITGTAVVVGIYATLHK